VYYRLLCHMWQWSRRRWLCVTNCNGVASKNWRQPAMTLLCWMPRLLQCLVQYIVHSHDCDLCNRPSSTYYALCVVFDETFWSPRWSSYSETIWSVSMSRGCGRNHIDSQRRCHSQSQTWLSDDFVLIGCRLMIGTTYTCIYAFTCSCTCTRPVV